MDSWSRNTVRVELGTDWVVGDSLMLGLGYRGAYGEAGVSHGAEARIMIDW